MLSWLKSQLSGLQDSGTATSAVNQNAVGRQVSSLQEEVGAVSAQVQKGDRSIATQFGRDVDALRSVVQAMDRQLAGEIDAVNDDLRIALHTVDKRLAGEIDAVNDDLRIALHAMDQKLAVNQGDLERQGTARHTAAVQSALRMYQDLGLGMSGDMEIQALPAEDVSAAALNAAAAGEFVVWFEARLASAGGTRHGWFTADGDYVAAENCTDADIGAPDVYKFRWIDFEDGSLVYDTVDPEWVNGSYYVAVVFDTDAGATKTYQIGDSVTVEVKVSAGNDIMGYTVASVTKTYNVIA